MEKFLIFDFRKIVLLIKKKDGNSKPYPVFFFNQLHCVADISIRPTFCHKSPQLPVYGIIVISFQN